MRFKDCVLILLAGVVLYLIFRPTNVVVETRQVVKRDTVYDTIQPAIPLPKIIERWRDTIIYVDSSEIKWKGDKFSLSVPLNRYVFEDVWYKIELEGFAVKPIRFEFIRPEITNEVVSTKLKQKRFNFGLFGGVGLIYGTKGVDVGVVVGIGVQYRFR